MIKGNKEGDSIMISWRLTRKRLQTLDEKIKGFVLV